MKAIKKILSTLVLVGLGIFMSLFVNFKILFPLLFPDPEKYAVENIQTGKLFDLLIEISSNTGYHPEPSIFYIGFAYSIGIVLGALAAYKLIWENRLMENKFRKATN
jgi:hypothetical protein